MWFCFFSKMFIIEILPKKNSIFDSVSKKKYYLCSVN